jgi:tetratricopeptide (TPR) repeat protein
VNSTRSQPARPEPVEGLPFFRRGGGRERQGFDKLSLSGFGLALLLLLPACSGVFSRSPEQSYQAGAQAWQEGRIREARIALMNALQGDPDNKAARLLQARIFLETGDGDAAEAELTRARQSGATPAETNHLHAHALLLKDDPRGAIEQARRVGSEHQSHAARVIALAQLALGDQKAAMGWFDRSVAADPRNSYAWLDIARFRRSIGDLGPALFATDKAVTANPNYADALVMRGELSRSQYGLAAAIPWFDRALEVDSGNLGALLERASTYGDMGRMEAMLADSRAALAIAPGHPLPYFLQATLAARGHNFDLARGLLARTGRAYDNMPAGMLLAAILSYQAEDYEDAARRLARLTERQPGNLKARRLLGAARLRLNDPQGAINALRTVADRPDADSYTLSLVATALERRGNRPLAARYRERAGRPQQGALAALLWSDNSHPSVSTVGRLLASGAYDQALARARAAQQAMPGAAEVHLLAGDVLATQGNHAAAAEDYRRAANLAFTESAAVRLIGSLNRSGQAQGADAVLQLFASQNPRNLSAQMMLAARALTAGEYEEAAARYERLRARIGNGDASLLNNLAWAYAGAGDLDRGLVYARRAWLLAPANPATAETLGWALFRHGDTAQGLMLLQAAARGNPQATILQPLRVAER